MGEGRKITAALPPLDLPSPTWIYCHTTGHLASTQWGGGGTMYRGRQRSREVRRRQEDQLKTSKLTLCSHKFDKCQGMI